MARTVCPDCGRPVARHLTLKGLLWAVFAFPVGIYCCWRTGRRRVCERCGVEIVPSRALTDPRHGYRYSYESTGRQPQFRRKTTANVVPIRPALEPPKDYSKSLHDEADEGLRQPANMQEVAENGKPQNGHVDVNSPPTSA